MSSPQRAGANRRDAVRGAPLQRHCGGGAHSGAQINKVASPTSVSVNPDGTARQPQRRILPDHRHAVLPGPVRSVPAADRAHAGRGGTPVNISRITAGIGGREVVNTVTSSAHGLVAGDPVNIAGVGNGFDGTYTVGEPAPTATTFSYDNSAGSNGCAPSCATTLLQSLRSSWRAAPRRSRRIRRSTSWADPVTVAWALATSSTSRTAAVTGTTCEHVLVPAARSSVTVSKKQLQSGTATLTVPRPPACCVRGHRQRHRRDVDRFNGHCDLTAFDGRHDLHVSAQTTPRRA